MRLFWIQLGKELHEQWATRRALVVLVVMLAFGLLSPISAKLLPDLVASLGQGQNVTIIVPKPTTTDALIQFVKNTNQIIVFVVLLLSFTAVVAERERGLMTLVFPHALPRSTFVLAKFVALALLLTVGILLEALAAYLYTTLLFTAPDPARFVGVVILLYVYLLLFVALAVLGSTLGQTTMAAAAITFALVVLVTLSGIFFSFAPGKLAEWAAALAMGLPAPPQWEALIATLLLTMLAAAASCLAISRQEIASASGT